MSRRPPQRLAARAVCLLALLFGCLLTAQTATAQSADTLLADGHAVLDRGVTRGDAAALQRARSLFERATGAEEHAALAHYYVALSSYRLIDLVQDEDRSDAYMDDAQKHLERALEVRPGWAEAEALLASVYGRKAGGGMFSGMRYGPKASSAMERAIESAPNNPRVLLTEAISLYNKPGMFGGDKEKAVARLNEAIARFEAAPPADPLQPGWGHAEAYAWLGIAHARADRRAEARAAFEMALEVRPGYAWVQQVLMPEMLASTD